MRPGCELDDDDDESSIARRQGRTLIIRSKTGMTEDEEGI